MSDIVQCALCGEPNYLWEVAGLCGYCLPKSWSLPQINPKKEASTDDVATAPKADALSN